MVFLLYDVFAHRSCIAAFISYFLVLINNPQDICRDHLLNTHRCRTCNALTEPSPWQEEVKLAIDVFGQPIRQTICLSAPWFLSLFSLILYFLYVNTFTATALKRAEWCADALANSIFSGPITFILNSMRYDGDPFTCHCKKEDKIT